MQRPSPTGSAVLRRPALTAALAAAPLLALTVPALSMHTRLPSFTDLPLLVSLDKHDGGHAPPSYLHSRCADLLQLEPPRFAAPADAG